MNTHLEEIPRHAPSAARHLARGDLQCLGRDPRGTLDLKALGLAALQELGAGILEGSEITTRQGDANAVRLL